MMHVCFVMIVLQWEEGGFKNGGIDCATYALGVEAAWRLQRWDQLEELLRERGENNGIIMRESDMPSMEDVVNISIGELLYYSKRNNRDSFKVALNKSRTQVGL